VPTCELFRIGITMSVMSGKDYEIVFIFGIKMSFQLMDLPS